MANPKVPTALQDEVRSLVKREGLAGAARRLGLSKLAVACLAGDVGKPHPSTVTHASVMLGRAV